MAGPDCEEAKCSFGIEGVSLDGAQNGGRLTSAMLMDWHRLLICGIEVEVGEV